MMQPPPPEDDEGLWLLEGYGPSSRSGPVLTVVELIEELMAATGMETGQHTPRVKRRRRRRET